MNNRLCIFSIYDPEGQVDEYIYYWLKELKTVADYIVVVLNGELQANRLREYADKIVERENAGFDGGAYADVILNHLKKEFISEFDEIILCNDTCYGPFISLQTIFNEMDTKQCDYWGIQKWDEGYASWINSFFLVFRKAVVTDEAWYRYFAGIDQKATNISEAYGNFEMGLNLWLKENGYTSAAYAQEVPFHNMKCPDQFIEKYDFPFFKRRSFCEEHYHEANVKRAFALIQEAGYDSHLILDNAGRRYDLGEVFCNFEDKLDDWRKLETECYLHDCADVREDEIIAFIKENKDRNIYVYGAGAFGSRMYMLFRKYMTKCGGFTLTSVKQDYILNEKVVPISEIGQDDAVIIGMNRKNTSQVLPLIGTEHVLRLYR